MEVNDELAVLRRALPAAIDAIAVGGRVVVESYHSLEDRLVKQAFAAATSTDVPHDLPFVPEGLEPALRLVTRGAEQADAAETAANPRAASVRLRADRTGPTRHERSSVMSSTAPQLRSRLPRIAEAAVERARLTVVPRDARARRAMPFVTLVSLLLLGGVVGLLLFNTSMQQASFATTALEDQATSLSAREQTLQMDLERLRDPQRLAEAAKRRAWCPPRPRLLPATCETGKVSGTWRPRLPRATPRSPRRHRPGRPSSTRTRSGAQTRRRLGADA